MKNLGNLQPNSSEKGAQGAQGAKGFLIRKAILEREKLAKEMKSVSGGNIEVLPTDEEIAAQETAKGEILAKKMMKDEKAKNLSKKIQDMIQG